MNALLVTRQLFAVVACQTVYWLDSFGMGNILRIEVLMAADTLEIGMRRPLESCSINKQRYFLPSLFH